MSGKRKGYLEWDDYFMAVACLSAKRSKDPHTQVGACIVNKDKRIMGIGYNGMPDRCPDDDMKWNKSITHNIREDEWLDSKNPYVCHAEMNAIVKNAVDVKGCKMYVGLFPCNECAKVIIQSGIREVVYNSDKYHEKQEYQASRFLLKKAGVQCSKKVSVESFHGPGTSNGDGNSDGINRLQTLPNQTLDLGQGLLSREDETRWSSTA